MQPHYEVCLMIKRAYIMNTFKCWDHGVDVSGALDASIHSSISHLSYHLHIQQVLLIRLMQNTWREWWTNYTNWGRAKANLLNWLVVVLWIHKFSHTKFLCCKNIHHCIGYYIWVHYNLQLECGNKFNYEYTFFKPSRVQVHTNYSWSTSQSCSFCSLRITHTKSRKYQNPFFPSILNDLNQ